MCAIYKSGPSKSFDHKFSLESWAETIVNAINYTLINEPIAKDKVLIIGHSEGGLVSSRVARLLNDKVSNVAILAGEGPTQLYSLYKFAADGTFSIQRTHMPTASERLTYLEMKTGKRSNSTLSVQKRNLWVLLI